MLKKLKINGPTLALSTLVLLVIPYPARRQHNKIPLILETKNPHSPLGKTYGVYTILRLAQPRPTHRTHACSPGHHDGDIASDEKRGVLWGALEEVVDHSDVLLSFNGREGATDLIVFRGKGAEDTDRLILVSQLCGLKVSNPVSDNLGVAKKVKSLVIETKQPDDQGRVIAALNYVHLKNHASHSTASNTDQMKVSKGSTAMPAGPTSRSMADIDHVRPMENSGP
ncbi:hypothetical protein OPT61_g4491 [Boeremia exigua]|uniref:Uncharacterized protein n=1 Tax=Boeremia exigua TaxID=749465 RepID=A0ACC2IDW6_9PLEO|nr:hypothetical protein OPT61_g4491 [Boeremia exigua]